MRKLGRHTGRVLTENDQILLDLVQAGLLSRQQIALQLGITEGTLNARIKNIANTLGVSARGEGSRFDRLRARGKEGERDV